MQYRINSPAVISETVDGEALIINLETGAYYSASETAEAIWALLSAGIPVPAAVEHLTESYAASREQVETAVSRMADEFAAESLLIPADGQMDVSSLPGRDVTGIIFSDPVLHKYTDMQELLVLDPIHEVAPTGWPNAAPGAAPAESR